MSLIAVSGVCCLSMFMDVCFVPPLGNLKRVWVEKIVVRHRLLGMFFFFYHVPKRMAENTSTEKLK